MNPNAGIYRKAQGGAVCRTGRGGGAKEPDRTSRADTDKQKGGLGGGGSGSLGPAEAKDFGGWAGPEEMRRLGSWKEPVKEKRLGNRRRSWSELTQPGENRSQRLEDGWDTTIHSPASLKFSLEQTWRLAHTPGQAWIQTCAPK